MTKVTINEGAQVYLDPTYGLRCPDAEALAAEGVVTASETRHGAGERVDVPADAAEALRATGVAAPVAKK